MLTTYKGIYYSGFYFHNQGIKNTDIRSIDMHKVSEFGVLCLFFKFVLLTYSLLYNLISLICLMNKNNVLCD